MGPTNCNGQRLLLRTRMRSPTHPYSQVWILQCTDCGHVYGANSHNFQHPAARRCPACQNGRKGVPVPDATRARLLEACGLTP